MSNSTPVVFVLPSDQQDTEATEGTKGGWTLYYTALTNFKIKIRNLAPLLYHAFKKRKSKYINYVPLYHYGYIYHAFHVFSCFC